MLAAKAGAAQQRGRPKFDLKGGNGTEGLKPLLAATRPPPRQEGNSPRPQRAGGANTPKRGRQRLEPKWRALSLSLSFSLLLSRWALHLYPLVDEPAGFYNLIQGRRSIIMIIASRTLLPRSRKKNSLPRNLLGQRPRQPKQGSRISLWHKARPHLSSHAAARLPSTT